MEWSEFTLAFGLFFLSHAVPVRPPVRPWLEARLGRQGFSLVYSLLSFAVLAWLISAAGRAPYVPLWTWALWQNLVALVIMLPVCMIVALAIGRPNPFSFGGARNDRFDPAQPGITGWMRHPLLVALMLWGGVHTLANGDLAHVFLFGTFAVFALLGGRLIDRRKQRQMGAEWNALQTAMADAGRPRPTEIAREAPMRIVAGLALYGALIWLHPLLFGVSPLP